MSIALQMLTVPVFGGPRGGRRIGSAHDLVRVLVTQPQEFLPAAPGPIPKHKVETFAYERHHLVLHHRGYRFRLPAFFPCGFRPSIEELGQFVRRIAACPN